MKAIKIVVFASAVSSILGCDAPSNKPSFPEATSVAALAPSTPTPASASRWNVSKQTNELDNKSKITLSTSDFVLRCTPALEGYIRPTISSLGHSLDAEDGMGQYVRYRIDDSPVKKQRWSMSTDFEALFIPSQTLRSAIKGKKLVVEYKPSYVVAQTETFDLDGLQDAARAAGCKV